MLLLLVVVVVVVRVSAEILRQQPAKHGMLLPLLLVRWGMLALKMRREGR